ncbi:hypothetical protein MPER_15384, partial [Moniliophthora perniciosa FA553]
KVCEHYKVTSVFENWCSRYSVQTKVEVGSPIRNSEKFSKPFQGFKKNKSMSLVIKVTHSIAILLYASPMIHVDSICPICFTSLLVILAEEEMAIAMDSPAHSIEELG